MTTGTRSGARRITAYAGTAALLLLAALGCANGSSTEKDFDSWLEDDPVSGATMTERSATNSIFGRNELFVTWTMTATPSRKAIVEVMKGACSFETKAMPRYTLVVDDVTLEIACRPENQTKVAAFWDAVHELDVTSLEFRQQQVTVRVDSAADAVATGVLDTVLAAATADDLLGEGNVSLDGQDRLAVSLSPDGDFDRELAGVHAVLDAAGPATRQVTAIPGEVIASTDGTVAQARAWEDAAQPSGRRLLVVGSAKTGWSRLPASTGVRDLVDQVASRDDVDRVTVPTDSWSVETTSLAASRALLALLAKADPPALGPLGPLDLGQRQTTTGDGACQFRVLLPDTDLADRLLDICETGAEVEQFSDADPRVTVPGTGLRAALTAIHALPRGTRLSITTDEPAEFVIVRVEQPLRIDNGADSPLAEQVLAIWKTLGPVG